MTVDCTDICAIRVQAMQCSPPKNSNPIPICNSLFIFEAAPENRQHLLAHTCDACDIFEFRFAHYNKLPEHVIDLFLLLLILLFCMMQRVIRKSEKRNKAGEGEEEKLNWLHYTDFIHKAIHCMRHISLCVCVYWCQLCRCNSRHMLSPDLIHIQSDLESDSDSHSYSDSDSDCESDSAWCRIASHRIASRFHFDGKQIYVQLKGSNTDWKLTDKCVCIFIVAIICLPWVAEWEWWGEERRGGSSVSRCFVCLPEPNDNGSAVGLTTV